MSLLFDADTEDVDHGGGPILDGASDHTVLLWLYPTSVTAANRQVAGNNTGTGTNFRIMTSSGGGTGRPQYFIPFDNTSGNYIAATDTLTVNEWQFLVYRFDTGDSQQGRIYRGSLSELATEINYSSTTEPVGTLFAKQSEFIVGADPANSFGFDGRVANIIVYDATALTLGQMQAHQFRFRPQLSGAVLYTEYGFNGTGTQTDLSGAGNSGTVTGATQDVHVPLAPTFGFDIPWSPATPALATFSSPPRLRPLRMWRRRY